MKPNISEQIPKNVLEFLNSQKAAAFAKQHATHPNLFHDEYSAIWLEYYGEVAAAIAFEPYDDVPDCLHIAMVAVLPEWRRAGLAARLLDALAKHAEKSGFKSIEMTVHRDNMAMQCCATHYGYVGEYAILTKKLKNDD